MVGVVLGVAEDIWVYLFCLLEFVCEFIQKSLCVFKCWFR